MLIFQTWWDAQVSHPCCFWSGDTWPEPDFHALPLAETDTAPVRSRWLPLTELTAEALSAAMNEAGQTS